MSCQRCIENSGTYVNGKVGVEEGLEVKCLGAGISHHETRAQLVAGEGDGICETKGRVSPVGGNVVAQHGVGQAEIELDRGVFQPLWQR